MNTTNALQIHCLCSRHWENDRSSRGAIRLNTIAISISARSQDSDHVMSALPNRTTFPSVFPSYYTTSDSTVSSNVQWLKCESFPSGKGQHFVAIQCWIRVVASKPHTKSCCSRNPLYTDQDFNSKLSSLAATMCGHDAMMIKMKEAWRKRSFGGWGRLPSHISVTISLSKSIYETWQPVAERQIIYTNSGCSYYSEGKKQNKREWRQMHRYNN